MAGPGDLAHSLQGRWDPSNQGAKGAPCLCRSQSSLVLLQGHRVFHQERSCDRSASSPTGATSPRVLHDDRDSSPGQRLTPAEAGKASALPPSLWGAVGRVWGLAQAQPTRTLQLKVSSALRW